MLLFDAEQQKLTLHADVNYMENYKALEEIKDFENLSLSTGNDFSLQKKKTQTGAKLPTLGSAMMSDSHERQTLREENERVKKMMQSMQEKVAQMLAGKSQMSEDVGAKIAEMEEQVKMMREERDRAVEGAEQLRKEVMVTKQEMQKKVNQLTQVTNMKKMIQDKNAKIEELRKRLGKYEGEVMGNDDDGLE